MDVLTISGQAEMRPLGPAKVFYLSNRIPISALLHFSSDYILAINNTGKITQISDNLLQFVKAEREAIIGIDVDDFPHPIFTSQEMQSRLKDVLDGKEVTFETQFQDPDREHYVHIRMLPTTFEDGSHGVTWLLQDITKRKEAENALKASERKFRTYLEYSPEYSYIISPDGRIMEINKSALETLGYTKEELLGKPLLSTVYAPSSQNKAQQLFETWKKTGTIQNEELEIITKQGEKRTVLLSAHSVKENSRLLHSVSVQRDITERKHLHKNLMETNWALKERVKELTFLYTSIREMQQAESLEDIGPKLVEFLVPSMQFPDIAAPVVEIEGARFVHERYRENLTHGIHAEICCNDHTRGRVSVYYTEDRPFILPQEENMLNALAESLCLWLASHKK
jgi:PAS domain S-box-containing protein